MKHGCVLGGEGNGGVIDPADIQHSLARGGYKGLERALAMQPAERLAELERSGLRGRGGAGFTTALKWRFCRGRCGRGGHLHPGH